MVRKWFIVMSVLIFIELLIILPLRNEEALNQQISHTSKIKLIILCVLNKNNKI